MCWTPRPRHQIAPSCLKTMSRHVTWMDPLVSKSNLVSIGHDCSLISVSLCYPMPNIVGSQGKRGAITTGACGCRDGSFTVVRSCSDGVTLASDPNPNPIHRARARGGRLIAFEGIYVKGSFEHVLRLCRPESVPENFPQVRSQPLGRWGDLERIGFENAQTPSGPAGCFLCSTLFVEGVQPDTIKTTCPFPVDIHCSGSKTPLDSKSVCFEGTLGSGFHVLDGDNSAVPG